MSEKRRALGRGLGALIPSSPGTARPVDVLFRDSSPTVAVDEAVAPWPADTTTVDVPPASNDSEDTRFGDTPIADANDIADELPAAETPEGLPPVPGATFAVVP